MATRNYEDAGRRNWQNTGARPLTTMVWYPAAPDARPSAEWGDPEARKLFAQHALAPGAAPAKGKFPVLLLSHGSTGQAMALSWMGVYFAARGYIAAAVNHHGNTSAETELLPQGFLFMWERTRDLSVVLDKLLEDPTFGAHVDTDRVVAAGHSSGGATVIELAGGVFDSRHLREFCAASPADPLCEPPPQIREWLDTLEERATRDPVVRESVGREGKSFKDRRVKAVFPMAPAVGVAFGKESLAAIEIPVHIVVGDADPITPAATNAQLLADRIPGAKLTILPRVDHMTFGSECTPLGAEKFGFCRDPEGVDRTAIHRQMQALAYELFERAFKR
ncbi:MAG: alpha/beta fold hydrolase [Bryobacteraceae bacterium]|nr:alpha/beta fold hydrolase [Bryobacteraceae bacterium]